MIRPAAHRLRRRGCRKRWTAAEFGPQTSSRSRPSGGGARIPIITTTLSEHFRVPVVTTPQPELTAAIGGGLVAVRGTAEEGMTSMAAAAPAAAAAAGVATQMAPEADAGEVGSSTFRALAWSDADDIPEVGAHRPVRLCLHRSIRTASPDARPPMQFDHEPYEHEAAPLPWYRRPALLLGAGVLAVLAALALAVLFVLRDESTPTPASTTTTTITTAPPPTTSAAPPLAPPVTQAPPPETRTVTRQAPPPPVTVTQAPPPPLPTTSPPADRQAPTPSRRPDRRRHGAPPPPRSPTAAVPDDPGSAVGSGATTTTTGSLASARTIGCPP